MEESRSRSVEQEQAFDVEEHDERSTPPPPDDGFVEPRERQTSPGINDLG